MPVKKICLLLIIPCLFSCGDTASKEQVKSNAPKVETSQKAKKPNNGSSENKKVTLGKVVDPAETKGKSKTTSTTTQDKTKISKKFYETKKYAFKIQQPENWEVIVENSENLPVIFSNKIPGTMNPATENITVAIDNSPLVKSLDDYYNFSHSQLLEHGKITSILEESKGKTANGLDFRRLMFNRSGNQGEMIAISYIFYNKIGYVVTCVAPASKFNAMRGFYEEVATSIDFF